MSCSNIKSSNVVINAIQGNSIFRSFELTNSEGVLDTSGIAHLYFTCSQLDCQKELIYNESTQRWELSISYTETASFPPRSTTFNLSAIFADETRATPIFEGKFNVIRNTNQIEEGD